MTIIADRVIGDAGAIQTAAGLTVDLRLPWYRSLPLSTVEVGAIEIDGEIVDPAGATLTLEDKTYPLAALKEQTTHVWYVLDSATLTLPGVDLADGKPHEIAVALILYPPYIRGLRRPTRDVCSQIVRREPANV